MNNNGQTGVGITLVVLFAIALVVVGVVAFQQGLFKSKTQSGVGGVSNDSVAAISQAASTGDPASVAVFVRNVGNTNQNTKVAVAAYCQDTQSGSFIIDGTVTSATAEIKGSTTKGATVKCWAFNSTFQTVTPVEFTVDEAIEHIVIDAVNVPINGKIQFHDEEIGRFVDYANASATGSNSQGTITKVKYTNNVSSHTIPVAGLYFSTIPNSNISNIVLEGAVTVAGGTYSATNIAKSDLGNGVQSRQDNWDYVFELDADANQADKQPLFLEQNDYIEFGPLIVESSNGCSAVGEPITGNIFTKGYYRSNTDGVKFGHQSDASPPTVISTDFRGDNLNCNSD